MSCNLDIDIDIEMVYDYFTLRLDHHSFKCNNLYFYKGLCYFNV